MRLSCVLTVRLRALNPYFKHFDQVFTVSFSAAPRAPGDDRGSAERAAYASLHICFNLTARDLSHGMEFSHSRTHTHGPCVHAQPHTQTHHDVIHLPYTQRHGSIKTGGNICTASHRVYWMEWLKKSSRNHKSDLWPSQPRSSLFTLRSFRGPAAAR